MPDKQREEVEKIHDGPKKEYEPNPSEPPPTHPFGGPLFPPYTLPDQW